MLFNLIVAVCRNNGIGYKGNIPWHIKADMQYFSKLTKGQCQGQNALVMGNNTWLSLQEKGLDNGLPKRDNFILSHKERFSKVCPPDNNIIQTFQSYSDFQEYIISQPYQEVWIIGGAQIYKMFLEKDIINKCYITYIDKDFECDTFFPVLEPSKWAVVNCVDTYDEKYACDIRYMVYLRHKS
jgi:dihydrofolate reductase